MKITEKLVKTLGVFMIFIFLRGLFIIHQRASFEKRIYEERKENGKKN